MRFLHIMQSVNPDGGGPIEALVRSEPAWNRHGHSREIVSLDLANDPWVTACPIQTYGLGSPTVRRLRRVLPLLRYGFTPALVPWLRDHLHEYDRVVVNGLWNFADCGARVALRRQAKPYFVFTHGMLDPWFRQAHPLKHACKQLSWCLVEGPLLHGSQGVLFTSEQERHNADRAFWPYRFRSALCAYGTVAPAPVSSDGVAAFHARVPRLGAQRYLLFLGRLHAKKGVDLLVEAFCRRAAALTSRDLVIAGPDSAGLQAALEARVAAAGLSHRVHWAGMLQGPAKTAALRGCDAFILPSHGENFGIAVAEALACGRPVLLSDRVNIAAAVEADDAGLVAPDTIAGVIDLLDRFSRLTEQARTAMGEQACASFRLRFDIDAKAGAALAILAGRTESDPIDGDERDTDATSRPHVYAEEALS